MAHEPAKEPANIPRLRMRMKAGWMSFRLMRLKNYGVFEALVCLLAHKVCGTPMYWYPKAERMRQRKPERELIDREPDHGQYGKGV